jgi:hypothetical protein
MSYLLQSSIGRAVRMDASSISVLKDPKLVQLPHIPINVQEEAQV